MDKNYVGVIVADVIKDLCYFCDTSDNYRLGLSSGEQSKISLSIEMLKEYRKLLASLPVATSKHSDQSLLRNDYHINELLEEIRTLYSTTRKLEEFYSLRSDTQVSAYEKKLIKAQLKLMRKQRDVLNERFVNSYERLITTDGYDEVKVSTSDKATI